MISLTRLSGSVFLLNADLVERVDSTPDTVVTLVDGTKYVVTESLDEIHDLVVDYRGAIVARSATLEAELRSGHVRRARGTAPVHLAAVSDSQHEEGGDQ
jgi:flagellar protein FlbD